MKKLLCLLILPIMAMVALTGCKNDKTLTNVSNLYKEMKASYVIEENNIFFADKDNPNSINIYYNDLVQQAVDNNDPITDIQYRYVALGYQQKVLDYIFNFYEKNQANFYKTAATADISSKDYGKLYEKIEKLNKTLKDFKTQYVLFVEDANLNLDEIMSFSIINYSYQVNNVIDSSFNFIYEFINIYEKYCVDTSKINKDSLQFFIDKAYVDFANIAYKENIKSFNFSVGGKGVCDLLTLATILDNNPDSQFNIIDKLPAIEDLSEAIVSNLDEDSPSYKDTLELVNEYIYIKDVFYQRLNTYNNVYNMVDIFTLNQYRYNIAGIDYQNYVNTLSISKRANIELNEDFVNENFIGYLNKMHLLLA